MMLTVTNRSPRGIFVYVDPNAPLPEAGSTRPSSAAAPAGAVGASLNDIIHAANSGNLRVDPATGDATMRALTQVQDEVEAYRRLFAASTVTGTRLGGGYAEQIDRFVKEWTVGGNGSVAEVMDQFSQQLGRLREAVQKSMATYEASDESGVRHLSHAEEGR